MWAACQIAKCRKKKLSSCMRNCNTVILKIYKVNSWASGNGELWVLPFFCLFFPQSKKITLSDTSSARNSSLRNTHSFSRTWPGVNYLPDYRNFRVVVGHYVTLTHSSSSFQECSGYKGHRRSHYVSTAYTRCKQSALQVHVVTNQTINSLFEATSNYFIFYVYFSLLPSLRILSPSWINY